MVSSIEILDPRFGSWTDGAPMNLSRGYAGAVVIGESIYIIGGVEYETAPIVLDIVCDCLTSISLRTLKCEASVLFDLI